MATETYSYPNPLASPKQKADKSYGRQYFKTMYNNIGGSGVKMFYNDRVNIRKKIAYFLGIQPVKPYQQRLDCWSEENPDEEVFMNINWQILNLAHRFINIIVGKIMKIEYDPICTPIDKFATDKMEQKKAMMKAYNQEKGKLEQLGVPLGKDQLGFDPNQVPETDEEIDMHFETAMRAEMGIQWIQQENDFHQIRKEYLTMLAVAGFCAVDQHNDRKGRTKMKHVHPASTIIGNSKSEDYKDAAHGGYVENITFAELRTAAGTEFSDEEYEVIYEKHCRKASSISDYRANDYTMGDNWLNPSNEKVVSVMRGYFKTFNNYTYEKKPNSVGNPALYKLDKDKSAEYKEKYAGERETFSDGYEVVYEGSWIVGTDYIYGYRLMEDMEVDKQNYAQTRIPLHVFAPNMLDGHVVSILENCIPIFDEIQINWLQFQHSISKYVPDGFAFDLDGLVSAPLGKGGTGLKPKQMLNMFMKTGNFAFSGKGINGQNGNGKPIIPIANSNIEKAGKFLEHIFTLTGMLDEIIGTNAATNASTPSSGALVGTAKLAAEGTNNALAYLEHADKMMFQHLSESAYKLLQCSVKRGNVSGMVKALGTEAVKFFEIQKGTSLCDMGIGVEARPTAEAWADLYMDMNNALKTGALEPDDKIALLEIKNLKFARRYMSLRQKEIKRAAEKANMDNIKAQGDINNQNAQQAAQAAQQALQLEYSLKKDLVVTEKQLDMELLKVKIAGDLQLRSIDGQYKMEHKHIEAEAKVATKVLEGENKLAVEEAKPKQKVAA